MAEQTEQPKWADFDGQYADQAEAEGEFVKAWQNYLYHQVRDFADALRQGPGTPNESYEAALQANHAVIASLIYDTDELDRAGIE